MIKNFLFDMDGTLIDCKADEFIPVYVGALKKRFAHEAECEKIDIAPLLMPTILRMSLSVAYLFRTKIFLEKSW